MFATALSFAFVSCNKDLPQAEPIKVFDEVGPTITEILNGTNYTFLKAAVTRANLTALLSDRTARFTFFAPDDAAFQASGIPSIAAINSMRPGQLDTLLRYHLVGGQEYDSARISSAFPNMYLQSMFVLQAPSATLPPGLRMPIFPSKRGTNLWVNNIPILQPNIDAANGVVHRVARVVAPPQRFLWNRIDTDPDLTYLKAAIQRADEGVPAASTLQGALQNAAANLTVFAPSNAAFQALLTAMITQALVAQGMDPVTANATATALASSPTVFTHPSVAPVITPTMVRGIIAYHILGVRAFSVNMPTAATAVPTLLNGSIANHPGVTLQATFGTSGVTAATVKGVANSTASNIAINPTPDNPASAAQTGTSDQHFINGVLHKIDQVLRPQ